MKLTSYYGGCIGDEGGVVTGSKDSRYKVIDVILILGNVSPSMGFYRATVITCR